MASGLKFRIFGIPVHVDNSFWVIAALLGFTGGTVDIIVSWVVVVFVSVLLHELGHAVAFRIYGQKPRVELLAMGGLTSGSAPLTGSRDVVVSLAGPLTGLLLLGVPALLLPDQGGNSILEIVRRELLFVNIAWSVVNLLPVLPLDGGQVAASVLRRFRGEQGQLLAYKVSIVTAGAAAVFAYQQRYVFGALFAVFFIAQNYGSLRQERLARQRRPLVAGYQALIGNDLDGAVSAADDVLAASSAPVPEVAASAVELKAWARLCAGDVAAASATLDDMPRGVAANGFLTGSLALEAGHTSEALDAYAEAFGRTQSGPWSVIVAETVARAGLVGELGDRLLVTPAAGVEALVHLQSHLHAAGRFPAAAMVGQRAFEAHPEDPGHVAYDVACNWARAGKPDDALDWLERAADAGLSDPALADDDPDLAPIRPTARYHAIVGRMGKTRDDGVPPAPAR
ncbi:MAG: TPR end-of-group domain-containing protein [Acidimicrobiales bacterium]